MLNKDLTLNNELFIKDVELRSTREGFGKALEELGKENQDVYVLCTDLTDSTQVDKFAKANPKRYIQTGIAEQNMMGIAAGLALSGKIPFTASYAAFTPSRNWDQIRVSVSYQNANVKIMSSHSGLSAAADGATAQALEDIALMRVLPNFTVIHPIDAFEAEKATHAAANITGPVYLRLTREKTPLITTKNTPFNLNKANILLEGDDVTLFSTGPITYEVLDAARQLKAKHNVNAEVIAVSVIKPLDKDTIIDSISKTGKAVSIEEHQIAGGLGSAIAEELSQYYPAPLLRMGVNDTFGQSGTYKELLDKYGLSAHHIVSKVLSFLEKK